MIFNVITLILVLSWRIVFKALSGEYSDRSCIGHIVKDCKSILGFLQTCSFSHTRQ